MLFNLFLGRLRTVAFAVAASILLTGCASTVAYDANLSPAQNQLRQSSARFNQTVGQGAVIGALLGAGLGAALGGRNRGEVAALGAAAGGALGAGAGYLTARNNLGRASSETQFNNAIEQASADADAYRTSASASQQIADQAAEEARHLNGQYHNRQISRDQYLSGIAKYRADNDIISKQVGQAQQAAAAMRQDSQTASGANRTKLATTAADVEASGQQLEQSQSRLSRILAGEA